MASTTQAPSVILPPRTGPARIMLSTAIIAILAMALALRLLNIANPPGFDEGKYSQGLMNMSRGFQPFAEIFNPQGPLFYASLFPFFKLGGETLEAARLGSVFWSMIGLGAVGVSGWLIAGRFGCLIALALLTVSPQYLAQGRVIQSEAASLGWALPAVALTLAGYRAAERRSPHTLGVFAGAAVVLAMSFAIKALTLGTAGLLLLTILLAPNLTAKRRLLALLLAGVAGMATLILVSLPFNLQRVWEQGVLYHAALKSLQPPDVNVNWTRVTREMAEEGWGMLAVAILGGLVWIRHAPRLAALLLGWTAITVSVLMSHSPLLNHHMVVLVPPLVLLGTGLARISIALPRLAKPVLALSGIGYLLALPTPIEQIHSMTGQHPPHQLVIDAGKQVAAVIGPHEFFVTDHPYAATMARRTTPPELADADKYRFESGWITDADLIRISEARDVKAALLWLGIYERHAPGYVQWLQDRFFQLWSSEQQGQILYVRKDIGTIDVSQLPGFSVTSQATFGADLEMLGFAYPLQVVPGNNLDIRMIWKATHQPRGDYRVRAVVTDDQSDRNPDSRIILESANEVAIGLPGPTTSTWALGDMGGARVRISVPADAPVGRAHLYIGLNYPDGTLASTQAREPDGKPRRNWRGLMFLSDLHIVARG
ncbi:MAG: ArnT family glycosyltransferase [Chloroflexota bacterium]